MKADPSFDVNVWDVSHRNPDSPWWRQGFVIEAENSDCVVSSCDRVEMVYPTFLAFQQNVPIVRIYAGINTSGGTHDDVVRRMLDSMGHILLCESEECRQNLIRQGEEDWRIPAPFGQTHLDDIEPDYSLCPTVPFALWLMNPVTISETETIRETIEAHEFLEMWLAKRVDSMAYLLPPNGDLYSNRVDELRSSFRGGHPSVRFFDQRPERNKFLGLLARCELFISNSSAVHYEFAALNSTGAIYNPSWRNAERTRPPKLEPGGSDRIISVLKSIDWSDKEKLLRKRFKY